MDPIFKYKISWWHLKAKKENDPWIRFVLYYLIFDAFITQYSQKNSDQDKLKWFLSEENSLRESIADSWNTKLLPLAKGLKSLSPIDDMRPNPGRSTELSDPENYSDVFYFIYQIRCNLFHGSKDLKDENDAQLVELSGSFLKTMIDWWLVSVN